MSGFSNLMGRRAAYRAHVRRPPMIRRPSPTRQRLGMAEPGPAPRVPRRVDGVLCLERKLERMRRAWCSSPRAEPLFGWPFGW